MGVRRRRWEVKMTGYVMMPSVEEMWYVTLG